MTIETLVKERNSEKGFSLKQTDKMQRLDLGNGRPALHITGYSRKRAVELMRDIWGEG